MNKISRWYNNKHKRMTFGIKRHEGEFTVSFDNALGMMITVYDDCLYAMAYLADLWANLSQYDNQNITQEQFIEVLEKCGFKEVT